MFYSCRVLLRYFIHEKKCVLPTMNLSTAKAIFGKVLCQLFKLHHLFKVYCIFHATAYLCSSYRVGQPPIPSLSARSLDSTRSLSLPWGTTARVINCFHSYKSSIVNKCRPILVQGLRRDIEINFHNMLCSSVDKCFAEYLKDPGANPSQGDFFHLNFF